MVHFQGMALATHYETAVHASSNLKAPNECALADGIGAAATKIRTSARPAGSLGKMLHHLPEQAEEGTRQQGDSTTTFVAVHESQIVQVFGRRNGEAIPALGQPASEKRQGTKSPCGAPAVQRGLWGFGGGVGVGKAKPVPAIWWLWREASTCVTA